MNDVFADAFYFIALSSPFDRHHEAAVLASEVLAGKLVTTHDVLIEVADALSSPRFRKEVAGFLRQLASDPGTEIIRPSAELYERGLNLYAGRSDKGWSSTDCPSFVVMSQRGLVDALTGDHHFEQAGFRALMAGR